MYETINATEFRRRLARQPDLQVIDVRTPAEFRQVHVAGAVNMPLDRLKPSQLAACQGPLHVLCRSGSRGEMACERLAAEGIDNVVHVEGGTLACVEVGVEVVRGKKAMSLERQVRIAAGSLVVVGVVLGALLHPAWLALAGFVGGGLVFAGVTDTCGMGMLISRAPWNQVADIDSPGGAPNACSRGA